MSTSDVSEVTSRARPEPEPDADPDVAADADSDADADAGSTPSGLSPDAPPFVWGSSPCADDETLATALALCDRVRARLWRLTH